MNTVLRPLAIVAALTLVPTGLLRAQTPAPAASPDAVVHIKDFAFHPAKLTVRAGQTVLFVNDDDEAHTATAVDRSFDSGGLDTHDRWTHVFAKPGTYAYICALHPMMKGVVVVTAASTGGSS